MKEKTTIIKNEGAEVRVLNTNSGPLFSLRDVLAACGIKNPTRWMSRERQAHPGDILTEKHPFPTMTECGRRQIDMIFVNADTGRRVVTMVPCGAETRKWLESQVFTYRQDEGIGRKPTEEPPTQKSAQTASTINSRIDRILIELLEIKKAVNSVGS